MYFGVTKSKSESRPLDEDEFVDDSIVSKAGSLEFINDANPVTPTETQTDQKTTNTVHFLLAN
jgi:hypothetical protein